MMIYDFLFKRITDLGRFEGQYSSFFGIVQPILLLLTIFAFFAAFAISKNNVKIKLSYFYCALYGSALGTIPGLLVTHNFFGMSVGAILCAAICVLVNMKIEPKYYIIPFFFAITQFVFIVSAIICCNKNTEQFFADLLGVKHEDVYEYDCCGGTRLVYDRHITVMAIMVIAIVVGLLITLIFRKIIREKNVVLFGCFQFLGSTYAMGSIFVNEVAAGDVPIPEHSIDKNPLALGFGYMPVDGIVDTLILIGLYACVSTLLYAGVKYVSRED